MVRFASGRAMNHEPAICPKYGVATVLTALA